MSRQLHSLLRKTRKSQRARSNLAPSQNSITNFETRVLEPLFPLVRSLRTDFSIIQSTPTTVITSSAVATTFSALSFTFSQLDQATQLGAVFDQYKFGLVEVSFLPHSNSNTALTSFSGIFTSVVDYDDAVVLTSQGQAMDYSSAVTTEGYNAQRRVFQPHIAVAAYTGGFTGFSNQAPKWIDSGSPNVIHYGIKTAWTTTAAQTQYDVTIRFLIHLRNVR